MLPFTVRIADGEPVSDQIVRAARLAISRGELESGDIFPSVRQMSQDLKVSPTTAHKVITQLKTSGHLTSRPGIGMVVGELETPSREERLKLLGDLCRRLLDLAEAHGLELEDAIEALHNEHSKRPNFGNSKP